MKILYDITRVKQKNTIIEISSFLPKNVYTMSSYYSLYDLLEHFSSIFTISLPLIKKYRDKNKIIKIFNFNQEMVLRSKEQYKFDYIPSSNKRCENCINYHLFNKTPICKLKLIKLKNNNWYKCLFWKESYMSYDKKNNQFRSRFYVYKRTRSTKDGRIDK